jgi:hypothetical protein
MGKNLHDITTIFRNNGISLSNIDEFLMRDIYVLINMADDINMNTNMIDSYVENAVYADPSNKEYYIEMSRVLKKMFV